ncbi:MAG TPA: HAMP domain-containing sensor histidine kinase [Gaiellaceae bacterium]|nr:HAMP domain-containing sensor histidine kinase [Gaiellaceae bacterium]
MSFRLRLTVLASLAVAVAIVGASFAVYYTDRHELIAQVDNDLSSSLTLPRLNAVFSDRIGDVTRVSGRAESGQSNVGKLLAGPVAANGFRVVLPRSSTAVQVQIFKPKPGSSPKAISQSTFSTSTIDGVPTRTLSISSKAQVVTISRSLLDVDHNLSRLRWLLIFISLGGIGTAAILGALVSGRAVAPLRRLTETTERIVETGDLSQRTGRRGRDEISRLSTRLDELLASLEASLRTQRQLVADASHELRTPIATLRANIGLLAHPGTLGQSERSELIEDVQEELESMTALVGELVELARGEEPDVVPTEFRLDEVVQGAVDRAARRAPDLSFQTRLEPSLITGVPERVERAVTNLLDNARKWSPPSETVDVAVHDGVVEVRDRGPGIAAEDAPLVFNRFYRAKAARGMPGAGLGLSIVKQIADAHGGSVSIDRAADGGAILRLQLSSTP